MQQVFVAVPVIHKHDEVWKVLAGLGAISIGHFQAEVMVLGVGDHFGMRFSDAAEFSLPIAIIHDPVDLIFGWRPAGVPAIGAGGVETDVASRSRMVVRVQQSLDGSLSEE